MTIDNRAWEYLQSFPNVRIPRRRSVQIVTLGFILMMVLCGPLAESASANYYSWSCTVQPNQWCQLTTAEPYYDTVASSSDQTLISAGDKFIELSGSDYATSYGVICNSGCADSSLYLYSWYLPQGWNLYPMVYNDDPYHAHTFHVISVW